QSIATFFPVLAWIASVFTFLYSMMIVFLTFFGKYKGESDKHITEQKFGMLVPPIVLSILVVGIFFFPNLLGENIINLAISSIYPEVTNNLIGDMQIWHCIHTELMMTIGIIFIHVILFLFRQYVRKVFIPFPRVLSFDTLYNNTLEYMHYFAKK